MTDFYRECPRCGNATAVHCFSGGILNEYCVKCELSMNYKNNEERESMVKVVKDKVIEEMIINDF
jgi:hypothetical protein